VGHGQRAGRHVEKVLDLRDHPHERLGRAVGVEHQPRGEAHVLVAVVLNKPGVLNRVSSLMRARNFNIDSLAVSHTDSDEISRMTITLHGDDVAVEQAAKQLYRLIDVLKVQDVTAEQVVEHELALIKVRVTDANRVEVIKIVELYKGSVVDVSLLATAMWTLSSDVLSALQGAKPRAMSMSASGYVNPLVGVYSTKDDRHISLVFLEADRYWPDFCRLIGRDELIDDPRFVDLAARKEHAEECVDLLTAEFRSRTFTEWKALLSGIDAPWAPVQAVEELLDDPQVVANDYIGEVVADGVPSYKLPKVPVQFDGEGPELRRAPEHGEHSELILLELGYSWDDIAALQAAGAIP